MNRDKQVLNLHYNMHPESYDEVLTYDDTYCHVSFWTPVWQTYKNIRTKARCLYNTKYTIEHVIFYNNDIRESKLKRILNEGG